MKTYAMLLLANLALPLVLLAQKPVSVTLTKPGSQTIKFDPKQKIPTLNLPCKLTNGKDRPFACEFSFDRLEFIGNDGSVLATVKPVIGQPKPTILPFDKAKKSAPSGKAGPITYTAKAYFTRRNNPSFPVTKGYQIRSCLVMACLQSDNISTLISGIQMPAKLLEKAVVTFDMTWTYGKKEGMMIGPHELYIENDVTTTKFAFNAQNTMRDKSEAWIDIQPFISGDPSPAN
jgi:hypothetical protein